MDAFGTRDPIQFATQTIPLALSRRGADQQEQKFSRTYIERLDANESWFQHNDLFYPMY